MINHTDEEDTQHVNDINPKRKNIFLKTIPLYLLALLFVITLISAYFIIDFQVNKKVIEKNHSVTTIESKETQSTIIRQSDSGLTKPLLLVEGKDDEILLSIKQKIINYLHKKDVEKTFSSASIYINNLNTSNHVEYNPDELYKPEGLMKLPVLIIYLKKAKENTDYLKSKILFKEKTKVASENRSYTIEDLLNKMILDTDSDAYRILASQIEEKDYVKLFVDLFIPVNANKTKDDNLNPYSFNINSISRFLRVLYNTTYLGRNMSQYAMKLLIKNQAAHGFRKGVESQVKILSCFGKHQSNSECQVHEFGIVYLKNNPYLLGVMTKGKSVDSLIEIMAEISKIVYEDLKKN